MTQRQAKQGYGLNMPVNKSKTSNKGSSQLPKSPLASSGNEVLFQAVVLGRVVSKKNSKRIVKCGRYSKLISSSQYLEWEAVAIQSLRRAWGFQKSLDQPLTMTIGFYFKNHANELDIDNCIAGPSDCLQLAGVISNDKIIMRVVAEKYFGSEPRVVIELKEWVA